MNLYATTTSERASKGQGGRNKVVINLQIDPISRKEIGNVVMTHENGLYTIYYFPINENCKEQKIKGGRVLLYQEEIKGKKQKTATKSRLCKYCKSVAIFDSENYCNKCEAWNG